MRKAAGTSKEARVADVEGGASRGGPSPDKSHRGGFTGPLGRLNGLLFKLQLSPRTLFLAGQGGY